MKNIISILLAIIVSPSIMATDIDLENPSLASAHIQEAQTIKGRPGTNDVAISFSQFLVLQGIDKSHAINGVSKEFKTNAHPKTNQLTRIFLTLAGMSFIYHEPLRASALASTFLFCAGIPYVMNSFFQCVDEMPLAFSDKLLDSRQLLTIEALAFDDEISVRKHIITALKNKNAVMAFVNNKNQKYLNIVSYENGHFQGLMSDGTIVSKSEQELAHDMDLSATFYKKCLNHIQWACEGIRGRFMIVSGKNL